MIPRINVADHFVYFAELLESPSSPFQQLMGSIARNAYNSLLNKISFDTASTQIINAINFITQVAANERNKETMMLNNISKKLNLNINDFYSNPDDYYEKLINNINEEILGIEEYKEKLQKIKDNINSKSQRHLDDYMRDDVRYRASSDMISGLKKLRRTYEGNEKQEVDSYLNMIQTKALEIAIKKSGDKIRGANFAALFSLITYNLEQASRDIMQRLHIGTPEQLKIQLQDFLNNYEQDLAQRDEMRQSELEKILFGENEAELNTLLNNLKKTYNIVDLDPNSSKYKEIEKTRIKIMNKRSKKPNRAISLDLLDKYENKELKESLLYIDFTNYGSTGFGNFQEVAVSAFERGIAVGNAGTGTDTVFALGQIRMGENKEILDEYFDNIEKILINNKYDNTSAGRMQNYQKLIDERNKNLKDINTKLENELKERQKTRGDIEKSFIIHDSVKLQSSAETGVMGGGFSGRTLSLISYIDELLSITDTLKNININPLDRDRLIYLGMNCIQNAVGQGNFDPLTSYFSIFAGMIMFDDAMNMAKETINQTGISNSTLYQIHLYNLNGIYVPASYILQEVSSGLQEVGSVMSFKNTSTSVQITTKAANTAIDEWKTPPGGATLQDWENMGNKVATSIKIKTTFLLGFANLINNLRY